MPIDPDKLDRAFGYRSHHDAIYEEQMERLLRDLPQPRILSCADEVLVPPKHTFWEWLAAYEECIAKGGRPG